jgi:DNA sulfur modification protein DndE
MAVAQFNSSRQAKLERDHLEQSSGLNKIALDRIAVALSITDSPPPGEHTFDGPMPSGDDPSWQASDGARHELHRLDHFGEGIEVFGPILEALAGQPLSPDERAQRLRGHINRGMDRLYRVFESRDRDWDATLRTISPRLQRERAPSQRTGQVTAMTVELGQDAGSGKRLRWVLNTEGGGQTNANLRIAGMPGVGKSQFLLHVLASVAEHSDRPGFILLDYKGDLSDNDAFLRETGATVIRPGDEPIPINPFQLPDHANRSLAPRAYAELFRVLSPKIGPVQESLVTDALTTCFAESAIREDRADARSQDYPTLGEIAEAIFNVYEQEGHKADSLVAAVKDIAGYNLFAETSAFTFEEVFKARWVINLSALKTLRTFVGFVLMEFLHQATTSLPDAAFDPEHERRQVRGVVAVDEAHYYFKSRCQPLLDLLRVGRSKGVPVFLSSQSLDDFKKYTELNEFLPNTFVLRHGMPPQARTIMGALHTDLDDGPVAASRVTSLDKFHALATPAAEDEGLPYRHVVLKGYWERANKRS